MDQIIPKTPTSGLPVSFIGKPFPRIILAEGEPAARRFIEFFAANIRNPNTRMAYARAVSQFLEWCDLRHLALKGIMPLHVASYIEHLPNRPVKIQPFLKKSKDGQAIRTTTAIQPLDVPSVKQHLAAIRMLFDWLVVGQIMPTNPSASVRGPKHVVKKGKTPVLSGEDARKLLDSIPLTRKIEEGGQTVEVPDLLGLRDRALIALMVYSFARIGAVIHMKVDDYYQNGKRSWIRLHEKGGKFHEVPVHHNAEEYLDMYLKAAGIENKKSTPLFRSGPRRSHCLSDRPMSHRDALRVVKRRAAAAGLPDRICCHTFRATGITAYLESGGTIENAQAIAAHESPRTTKLYDRTKDEITLDEIERISI